ncbi:uncharacterized protein LOC115879587 [Sitophilus oryzae]|uniref:Uncharacterized protein LOC115879587 n=1 Tax=Sitophilus oryzae TaxID=7048 RepID=A0A6J2XNA6_SITOR|nr:uncharacterized protein LOC115879587 [Sitophilus oryzae]
MSPASKTKTPSQKYTEDDVQKALTAINNGTSQRKAALQFKVPRATLQFRASENFHDKTTRGPNPILSLDEETRLKDWICACQKKGFPLRIEDVQHSVKGFLDAYPRENPFIDNMPGKGWYRSFLKRNPEVTLRTPEAITAASSNISEKDIRKWFSGVEQYLDQKGYYDILKDPSRIFNGDETCFYLSPKNKRVLAVRGSKNVYEIKHHSKVNLTVMFTFAASGDITPPMVIYPYKRLPSSVVKSVPAEWGIGCSNSGWMKNEIFFEHIGNVYYKHLVAKNIKFPIILFVDGHTTHMTLQTSELCSKLKIILVALYPNATRIMQPADVAAFKSLKIGWNKAVLNFRRENPNSVVTKENFALVLNSAISSLKSVSIINGFKTTGLYPWNPSAIDYSKYLGKNNSRIKESVSQEVSITYADFEKLVGTEKIKMFQNNACEDLNEEAQILYNMFQLFKNKPNDAISNSVHSVRYLNSYVRSSDLRLVS